LGIGRGGYARGGNILIPKIFYNEVKRYTKEGKGVIEVHLGDKIFEVKGVIND